jgi:Holliday junction DNA helicase RuvA
LAEKVGGLQGFEGGWIVSPQVVRVGETEALADAASALVNLGYSQATAWQALRTIEEQLDTQSAPPRIEELIRLALRFLAAR